MVRQSSRVAKAEAARAASTPELEDDAMDIEEPKPKVTKKKPVGRPKANSAAKRADPAKKVAKPKAPTAAATKAAAKAALKAATEELEDRPVKAATGMCPHFHASFSNILIELLRRPRPWSSQERHNSCSRESSREAEEGSNPREIRGARLGGT